MTRQVTRRWFVVWLAVALLAGCVISQQPANLDTPMPDNPLPTATDIPLPILATNTSPPADDEAAAIPPIVFESSRDGVYNLYAVYPDGTGITQLTHSDAGSGESNGSPAWSPDGTQVAFSSRRSNDWDIHSIAADGAFLNNLTALAGEDDKASWSPDGAWIVFNSRRNEARWADIWMMNADGSSPVNLTDHPDDDREPAWSPNGMEIAFRSFRDGNYEIYVMDVESRATHQLTQTDDNENTGQDVWNGMPTWSPNSEWIAFETDRDGDWNVYIMDNNGSNLRNLTPHSADDQEPAWSPDGRFLAFTSNRDGNDEIYTLEIETGEVQRLTYDCAGDYNASWRSIGANGSGEPVRTAVAYAIGTPNLRSGPSIDTEIVTGAAANECLTVTGRSTDGMWLRSRTSTGNVGWVLRDSVSIQGSLDNVPVTDE